MGNSASAAVNPERIAAKAGDQNEDLQPPDDRHDQPQDPRPRPAKRRYGSFRATNKSQMVTQPLRIVRSMDYLGDECAEATDSEPLVQLLPDARPALPPLPDRPVQTLEPPLITPDVYSTSKPIMSGRSEEQISTGVGDFLCHYMSIEDVRQAKKPNDSLLDSGCQPVNAESIVWPPNQMHPLPAAAPERQHVLWTENASPSFQTVPSTESLRADSAASLPLIDASFSSNFYHVHPSPHPPRSRKPSTDLPYPKSAGQPLTKNPDYESTEPASGHNDSIIFQYEASPDFDQRTVRSAGAFEPSIIVEPSVDGEPYLQSDIPERPSFLQNNLHHSTLPQQPRQIYPRLPPLPSLVIQGTKPIDSFNPQRPFQSDEGPHFHEAMLTEPLPYESMAALAVQAKISRMRLKRAADRTATALASLTTAKIHLGAPPAIVARDVSPMPGASDASRRGSAEATSSSAREDVLRMASVTTATYPRQSLPKFNSCSTLFIDSTLTNADLQQTLKCVGIAVVSSIRRTIESGSLRTDDILSESLHPISRHIQFHHRIPTESDVYKFLECIFRAADLTVECAVIMLIYVERMLLNTNITLHSCNWALSVLGGLILASKVWDDHAVWNVDFCQIFPEVDVASLNELERWFLRAIRYNVSVKASTYARYYFELRDLSDGAVRKSTTKPLSSRERGKLGGAASSPTASSPNKPPAAKSSSTATQERPSTGAAEATESPIKRSQSDYLFVPLKVPMQVV
ncbi:hypothetical protein DFJ73DRAFT_382986 [Zopfochytrium polystomum]|nr:hypothetical protein DFJ73DRAFT_382986 [Zopfochytrium polystomum]